MSDERSGSADEAAVGDDRADHERSISLGDGRTLAYLDIGDPGGYPVINNHGGLSSRLDIWPASDAARARQLRLISPDRPGIGRSDANEGHTIESWANDVEALADQLGLDRFAVIGWSFGGGYAQAVARYLSERVSTLVLVASVIPREWAGMREEINRMDRVLLRLSHNAVGRLDERTIFHVMGHMAAKKPERFAKLAGFEEGGPALTAAIAEGLSNTEGVVADYEIMNQPWGFDPSDITVPTHIWQGDADELVPPDWATRLNEAIAGSTVHMVEGGTHLLWYEHWDDLFADVT